MLLNIFHASAVTQFIARILPVFIVIAFTSACNNAAEKTETVATDSDNYVTTENEVVAADTAVHPVSDCSVFPVNPPKASTLKLIPRKLLLTDTGKISLSEVLESKLIPALESAGYEYSFYCYRDSGIAVVTRLEKINEDGTSKNNNERYLTADNARQKMNPLHFFLSLFRASPGYYRVIVFIISPQTIRQSNSGITKNQADSIFESGDDRPSYEYMRYNFSGKYACTALIYQFIKPNAEDAPRQITPSSLSCQDHLTKAKIWSKLSNTR